MGSDLLMTAYVPKRQERENKETESTALKNGHQQGTILNLEKCS